MRFTKLHGAGNDYIVIDGRGQEAVDWNALARLLCHRHLGVGADGIALIVPSRRAPLGMRILNPDGSEAEMSGNGIRCLAKYVLDRGLAPLEEGALVVDTPAGLRRVEPLFQEGRVVGARVGMGTPRFHPREVPLDTARLQEAGEGPVREFPLRLGRREVRVTCLSLGNPHAVTFVDGPVEEFPLGSIGPRVEHHPLFPQRVNFEVARVLGPGRIQARIWERGAGETPASGTGASAVAVAARLLGRTGSPVDITLPGGTLRVTWDGEGEVVLEGPVEEVCEGEWRGPLPQRGP